MKILIASSIDASAVDRLRQAHDVRLALKTPPQQLEDAIRDREALIFRSGVQITAGIMANAPGLRLLIRAGSGIDNLDLDYVRQRGLALYRVPEPGARAVSEMSFAFMLALSRRIGEADRLTRQGHWAKNELTGYLLHGKVLGIVGAGDIGSLVGEMGHAWGMNVLGCVEPGSPVDEQAMRARGIRITNLEEVISSADYLSIHVPLQTSTRNLISGDVLSKMKPGSYLINLARGGVVDEKALYRELTAPGRLRGAALDVHQEEGEGKISPLADLPNVILTPHIGAETVDTKREIGEKIIQIVDSFCGQPGR
jgi:phosphoglycerate dehydrogenase-like enzyme